MTEKIYRDLGVSYVINASGNGTVMGGSRLSPGVLSAMAEANRQYVWMQDLLERAGEVVAGMLGAEAAYVSSGCAAALVLGSAACMAGMDREKTESIPDTGAMKNEVLIQKGARGKYDRCMTISGARLVEVGHGASDGGGQTTTGSDGAPHATAEQIETAINENTAAIHYLASAEGKEGIVPLEQVLSIGHARGVPVILDAASMVYPLEKMLSYPRMGVDLVCYGAKYFGAPHSTGILCGRKDLVEAAAFQGFIGFETSGFRSFGRAMKVDRQEIVGLVTALKEWFAMDHEARLDKAHERVMAMADNLADLRGVTLQPVMSGQGKAVGLSLVPEGAITAADLSGKLWEGEPRIRARLKGGAVTFHLAGINTLAEGEEDIIVRRVKEIFAEVG